MRFGFVGLGRAARLYHLPAVRALDDAQTIGGFDASEQQRAAWARETGMPAFASLEELLATGAFSPNSRAVDFKTSVPLD